MDGLACCLLLFAAPCATVEPSAPIARADDAFLSKDLAKWRDQLQSGRSAELRRSAAFALSQFGPQAQQTIPDLFRAVSNDQEGAVRAMSAWAIGEILVGLPPEYLAVVWTKHGPRLLQHWVHETHAGARRDMLHAIGAMGESAGAALELVCRASADPNASIRQNAVWAMGRIGRDRATLARLCERLHDSEALVRRDAASALRTLASRWGTQPVRPAVAVLLAQLPRESDEIVLRVMLDCVARLASETDRERASVLHPLLRHANPDLRGAASLALAGFGGEPSRAALPVLQTMLRQDSLDGQIAAAAALDRMGAEALDAAADLVQLLRGSNSQELRCHCAIALGAIGEDLARRNAADDRRKALAEVALPALMAAARPSQGPGILLVSLKSASPTSELRDYALEAIARIGQPHNQAAHPLVKELLTSTATPPDTRQRALWILFNCPDLDRLGFHDILRTTLQSTDPGEKRLRYDAARLLAWSCREQCPPRVGDILAEMLRDSSLREYAGASARIEVLSAESRKSLPRVAPESGGDARHLAIVAMGWLGSRAADHAQVIEALKQASRDGDPALRQQALDRLRSIGTSADPVRPAAQIVGPTREQ